MDTEMGMMPGADDLRDWFPIRVYWREQDPMLDWCYMGDTSFTDPFFDNTVTMQMSRPFSRLFRHRTPIELLGDILGQAPGLSPTGFIFHMSRCGSTLVSQMLAALDHNIVISEAPPIDSILRASVRDPSVTDDQRATWLRWMVGAFGRKRTGRESGYFIKFDSWSMIDLDIIERAFPDVPWIFLYRDPVEVIVSQIKGPGVQMIRGSIDRLLPGLPVMEALQMPNEEYCARVLGRFCEVALLHSDRTNAKLVEYTELPGAVTGRIAEHFGITFSPDDLNKIAAVTKFDAKTPQMNFTPDSQAKKNTASDAVLRAASEFAEPFYNKLRIKQQEMNGGK